MLGQKTKVADEVWIILALLHRENPKREDFIVTEIVERARQEKISGELRPGVQVHAYLHCVANRPPNPGRYRMLYATGKNTRRLFRETDDFDPRRPKRKIFRSSISHCWTGITKISSRRERVPKKQTRSLDFRDWGKRSGSAKIRMSMSAGFAEAGSEPDFLGYEFVHLSDRGIW